VDGALVGACTILVTIFLIFWTVIIFFDVYWNRFDECMAESCSNLFIIVDIHFEWAKKLLKKGSKVPTKSYEMLIFKTTICYTYLQFQHIIRQIQEINCERKCIKCVCNFRAIVIQLYIFHCFKKFNCMTRLKSWSMLESLRVHSQIKEWTYWVDTTYCVLKLCHTNRIIWKIGFLKCFPLFAKFQLSKNDANLWKFSFHFV